MVSISVISMLGENVCKAFHRAFCCCLFVAVCILDELRIDTSSDSNKRKVMKNKRSVIHWSKISAELAAPCFAFFLKRQDFFYLVYCIDR